MTDLLSLPLNNSNASFRFESAYEVIREILQAFLALEGYKPYSHEAILVFTAERKIASEVLVRTIDRYREIRNDINYRGKKISTADAKEIIDFANKLFHQLKKKINF